MGEDKRHEEEMVLCPVGRFFMDLERAAGKKSKFLEHLGKSRMEFLKAVRSLVDEKIQDLEKKETGKKNITKIEVE